MPTRSCWSVNSVSLCLKECNNRAIKQATTCHVFVSSSVHRSCNPPWATHHQRVAVERSWSKQLCLKRSQVAQHTESLLSFIWGTVTPSSPLQRRDPRPLTMTPKSLLCVEERWKTMDLFRWLFTRNNQQIILCFNTDRWQSYPCLIAFFCHVFSSGCPVRSCQQHIYQTTALWIPALCMKKTARRCFYFSSASAGTPQRWGRSSQGKTRPVFAV